MKELDAGLKPCGMTKEEKLDSGFHRSDDSGCVVRHSGKSVEPESRQSGRSIKSNIPNKPEILYALSRESVAFVISDSLRRKLAWHNDLSVGVIGYALRGQSYGELTGTLIHHAVRDEFVKDILLPGERIPYAVSKEFASTDQSGMLSNIGRIFVIPASVLSRNPERSIN